MCPRHFALEQSLGLPERLGLRQIRPLAVWLRPGCDRMLWFQQTRLVLLDQLASQSCAACCPSQPWCGNSTKIQQR
eukprot:4099831-Amphidinium_carterae.2